MKFFNLTSKKGEPYACILYYQEQGVRFFKKKRREKMGPIEQIAMQAASQAAGQAGGSAMGMVDELLLGNRRRKKQIEQQKKLTDIQVAANKDLAIHNKELEFDLWNKTNYEAQIQHMKNAGLNPALMYGQAGGGVTGTAGQSASGSQASSESEMMNAATQRMGMGLQLAMQKAQIKNIEADTKQKEAEAEKTATVDTELTRMSIKDITATINNKEVQREGLLLENNLKILEYAVMYDTSQDRANEIKYRAESAKQSLLELQRSNEIGEETKQQVIDSYRLKLQDLAAEIILKEASTQVNKEQAKKIIQDISNSIQDLKLKGEQVNLQTIETETKRMYPNLSQSGGRLIQAMTGLMNNALAPIDKKFFKNKKY